jgi:hypothetical protein
LELIVINDGWANQGDPPARSVIPFQLLLFGHEFDDVPEEALFEGHVDDDGKAGGRVTSSTRSIMR